MKYLRTYEIRILTPEGELLTIKPPFSMQAKINRNTLSSANKCSLTIYNLSPSTRSKIYKDRFTTAEYWQMTITAGYKQSGGISSGLKTTFQGNIQESVSFKQGTEYVTQIEAFDGLFGIQNGFTAQTISKNTDKSTIIRNVIKDMPNVVAGVLGTPSQGTSSRGQVLLGQSSNVLANQTGGAHFIDSEVVNVLSDEEYIGEDVILLDSEQLLTTPKRRETFLDCSISFTPELQIGYLGEINSRVKEYNGQYKIMGFTHDFSYMGSSVGRAITTCSLFSGANALRKAI